MNYTKDGIRNNYRPKHFMYIYIFSRFTAKNAINNKADTSCNINQSGFDNIVFYRKANDNQCRSNVADHIGPIKNHFYIIWTDKPKKRIRYIKILMP